MRVKIKIDVLERESFCETSCLRSEEGEGEIFPKEADGLKALSCINGGRKGKNNFQERMYRSAALQRAKHEESLLE